MKEQKIRFIFTVVGLLLFISVFVATGGFVTFSASKEQAMVTSANSNLKLFTGMYEDYTKHHLMGYVTHIDTYKRSYYYPFIEYPVTQNMRVIYTKTGNILELNFNSVISKNDRTFYTDKYNFNNYNVIIPYETDAEYNLALLKSYTQKIYEKEQTLEHLEKNINNAIKVSGILKPKLSLPEIINSLPNNKEELKKYLSWISKIEGYDTPDELVDVYGTQIEFKLTADGLEAVSAGQDKIFGTTDDQSYLSRYDDEQFDVE